MTPEGFGTSFLYIPVTAPNNNTFACIGLRAMDNITAGLVRAEFWRQPRNANPGPAGLIRCGEYGGCFCPCRRIPVPDGAVRSRGHQL